MDEKEARRLIREIAKLGWVRATRHCLARMAERNVTMDDLLQALLWGEVCELETNVDYQNWACLVRGMDLEEEPLVVKVAILVEESALLCITVHG